MLMSGDYVKSFDWFWLSSTFCTSAVPHSSSGISAGFETSGEGNCFLEFCTPVNRAISIHCCNKHRCHMSVKQHMVPAMQ
jgi:hypothetical protein